MSTKHVFDELSAYMDGECSDPQRIARHLQSCPECARRHMELLRLSNHLCAMPRPELSSAFTTRVLVGLEANTSRQMGPVRFIRRPAFALALAASLVLIGIGAAYNRMSEEGVNTQNYSAAVAGLSLDDEAVILALGDLLDAEGWEDLLLSDETGEEAVTLPTVDALLDTLAVWTLEENPTVWYEEQGDWSSMMEALALEDVDLLDDLTRNHWDEV